MACSRVIVTSVPWVCRARSPMTPGRRAISLPAAERICGLAKTRCTSSGSGCRAMSPWQRTFAGSAPVATPIARRVCSFVRALIPSLLMPMRSFMVTASPRFNIGKCRAVSLARFSPMSPRHAGSASRSRATLSPCRSLVKTSPFMRRAVRSRSASWSPSSSGWASAPTTTKCRRKLHS